MHHAAAGAGFGQAVGVFGEVWEGVPLSEVRVCAGAVAELCEVAGEVLPGMPGEVSGDGAVCGEGDGGVGVL